MLIRDRTFIVHTAGAALGSAAMFAYIGGVPFVYMKLFGISETHFGYFFGANAAGLITSAQVNGWLVKRFDPAKVLRCAMAMEATAGCFLLFSAITGFGGMVGVMVPLFLMVSSLGYIFPNTTALAMEPHPKVAGNASAILGCGQFGISGIGGFLVSAFHNGTAVPMSAVIAICASSALVINLLFAPPNPEA
jgi:DHA1 family bicyclomycin/chloramphenicol resistance-like MFS transporter